MLMIGILTRRLLMAIRVSCDREKIGRTWAKRASRSDIFFLIRHSVRRESSSESCHITFCETILGYQHNHVLSPISKKCLKTPPVILIVEMESFTHIKSVAIFGAGPAGLTAVK